MMQGAHRPRSHCVINLDDIDSILQQADFSLGGSRLHPQQKLGKTLIANGLGAFCSAFFQ